MEEQEFGLEEQLRGEPAVVGVARFGEWTCRLGDLQLEEDAIEGLV